MIVDNFTTKLNCIEGKIYTIEEEARLVDGRYKAFLKHDNVNSQSVNVYSGSKLTGEKINNVILSIPSEEHWKTDIEIFSNYETVYITYETIGDTVEAEDINVLQDSIVNAQTEINEFQSHVNAELLNRYTRDKVFTKEEVLSEIEKLINNAPDVLDTFAEISKALGNDPNFANTMTTMLSKKVDKVTGKQLSDENYTLVEKSKLANIQNNANNYSHPSTHDASMITGLSDVAKSGSYNDLANKPTTMVASGGHSDTSSALKQIDSRFDNFPPGYYYQLYSTGKNMTIEFKNSTYIGLTGLSMFGQLQTWAKWSDPSGGAITQVFYIDTSIYIRASIDMDNWGSWTLYGARHFAPTGFGLGAKCVMVDDWNNVTNIGFYMSIEAKNQPFENNWCFGYVIAHNDIYVTQVVQAFSSTKKWYIRNCMNGVWESWVDFIPTKLSQLENDIGVGGLPSHFTWDMLKGV